MRIPRLKIIIISSFLLFTTTKIKAQYSEEEVVKKGYTTDGIINILIDHIPGGWNFKEENGFFVFQRNDSVWVLSENTLNVPFEKKEDRNKRIQAYGKKTVSKIIIRYEDKWDFLKLQEADLNNSSIYNEMRLLPNKMNISKLKDIKNSNKGNTVYTPITMADKISIENYYKEREKLQNKIIKVPDHNTQKYSLFIVSKTGCNDESHLVYPDAASIEVYGILNFLREICGK
jgi:hypothetical protein